MVGLGEGLRTGEGRREGRVERREGIFVRQNESRVCVRGLRFYAAMGSERRSTGEMGREGAGFIKYKTREWRSCSAEIGI